MNPVMYLISNPRVPMTKGKFAAQAAHAAVQAYRVSPDNRLKHIWDEAGQQYAKVVLQSDDLLNTWHYVCQRGFMCVPIFDEGRTEFDADLTLTFLGVQIVDKDRLDVKNTFSAFKLYREPEMEDPRLVMVPLVPLEEKRTVKDWLKERFNGNTTQRDS